MSCQHLRRAIKRTYLGKRESGKLAASWTYCVDCGAFLSKRTTVYAFTAGGPGFYDYWEKPE